MSLKNTRDFGESWSGHIPKMQDRVIGQSPKEVLGLGCVLRPTGEKCNVSETEHCNREQFFAYQN